jgi:signal transduction histidine kinase
MLSARGETGTGDRRVAEVAHDLRMPLALILAHCEQLATTLVDRDQVAELDRIRDTTSRMARQVDGLMLAETQDRTTIDVTALVAEVVDRFRPLARARGRDIAFECPASAVVLASASDLELALQNIIDNALRNARTAPVRVSVHVGMRHVSIDVADDGPGIPASQRRTLLDAGAQGAGGGQTPGGVGLGLSIANAAILAQGGRLHIGDAPEGGALVTLQIPTRTARPRRRRRRLSLQPRAQIVSRA